MMTSMLNKPMRMQLVSVPTVLPVVRAALEKLCGLIGFDADSGHAVVLSVDEALTNIIRHAYRGADDKTIDVEMTAVGEDEPTGIRIRLRDYGPGVDPKRIKARDLEDVRPGGLGVHIIRECMDTVEYAPAEDGGTVLTMFRRVDSKKQRKGK